ncbi:MAG: hypothetical protein JRI25_28105 [Deltaproteobacteria bacterium]|nr:hypothetical protein [Deltaproteobacteria bacterium]
MIPACTVQRGSGSAPGTLRRALPDRGVVALRRVLGAYGAMGPAVPQEPHPGLYLSRLGVRLGLSDRSTEVDPAEGVRVGLVAPLCEDVPGFRSRVTAEGVRVGLVTPLYEDVPGALSLAVTEGPPLPGR